MMNMYEQEKITPYHDGEKASQVEQMFDNIAPTYDKLNHRLSWDIDKGWRKKAIKALAPYQPQSLLDIATGTGDFAILAAQMLQPKRLVGADISEGMMDIGRQKVKALGLDDVVTFEQLGVDRLFVDESHFYKNLFLYTKMRNVAGISQTDAQKSSDMFMKLCSMSH